MSGEKKKDKRSSKPQSKSTECTTHIQARRLSSPIHWIWLSLSFLHLSSLHLFFPFFSLSSSSSSLFLFFTGLVLAPSEWPLITGRVWQDAQLSCFLRCCLRCFGGGAFFFSFSFFSLSSFFLSQGLPFVVCWPACVPFVLESNRLVVGSRAAADWNAPLCALSRL